MNKQLDLLMEGHIVLILVLSPRYFSSSKLVCGNKIFSRCVFDPSMLQARHNGQNYVFALLTGYRDPPAGINFCFSNYIYG